jgi:hypothetical protein
MHDTGKDARWKSMLRSDVSPLEYRKNKTRSVSAKLDSPSALMLRLRALLGLGIRADVIAFLLCDPEAYVSSADIAAAIGYNSVAVRRVLTTMVASGGLSITDGPNEEYSIKHQPLRKILGIPDASLPRWRYCRELFSLSAHTLDRDRTQSNTVSDFVLRTSARRMLDTHRRALVKTGIVPRHQTTGLEQVFPDIITQVTTFIQKNV